MTGIYGDGKPDSETREERDVRLEGTYRFNRQEDEDLSVVAIVSRDQRELAEQFFRWRQAHPGGELMDALLRWEEAMFGRALEPSAHGMLRFAVRRRLSPAQEQPSRPSLSPAERQRRFDEAAGRTAREKAWPQGQTESEREAKLALLREQAAVSAAKETE